MSISIQVTTEQVNLIYENYKTELIDNPNVYVLYCFKINNSKVTIYKTNKVLIQGKDEEYVNEMISKIALIPYQKSESINKKITKYHSTIGSDEVGTGDFFGGIVVCACYVGKDQEQEIIDLGVKDSKLLTDEKILEIGPVLMEKCTYSYRYLDNRKYNNLYQNKKIDINMNKIKAILHNFVLVNLEKKVQQDLELIVIDAFTSPKNYFNYLKEQSTVLNNVRLIEKAEKLFTSVACASCIARYIFLKNFETLKKECGYDLPKGAGPQVDMMAAQIIRDKSLNYLNNIAKMNFKTVQKALTIVKENK